MKVKTHKFIISNAVEKLDIDLFKEHKKYLLKGARKADYALSHLLLGGFNHFYNPIKNRGLWYVFSNAKKRGEKIFEKSVKNYHKGKIKKSMIQLGIALHLMQDSAMPAHSNPRFHLPYFLKDDLENFINKNLIIAELYLENIKTTIKNSIDKFFEDLAKATRDFKQGRHGIIGLFTRIFGAKTKKQDLFAQTKKIIPLSVSYTMGALQIFYDRIKK
jgi:hypothetical protein